MLLKQRLRPKKVFTLKTKMCIDLALKNFHLKKFSQNVHHIFVNVVLTILLHDENKSDQNGRE